MALTERLRLLIWLLIWMIGMSLLEWLLLLVGRGWLAVGLLLVGGEHVLCWMSRLANAVAVAHSVAGGRPVGRSSTKMTVSVLTVSVAGVVGPSVHLTSLIAAKCCAKILCSHITVLTRGDSEPTLAVLLRVREMTIGDVVLALESASCLLAHHTQVGHALVERGLVAIFDAHFRCLGSHRRLKLALWRSIIDRDCVDRVREGLSAAEAMAIAVGADVLVEGTAQVLSSVLNRLFILPIDEHCGSVGDLASDSVVRDDVFCSIFIYINVTELDATPFDRVQFL